MHATDLLSTACPDEWKEPLPEKAVDGTCCLTGQQGLTINRRKVFGSSFTELEIFKVPDSDRVGVNVWHAFRAGYFAEAGKKRKKKPEAMACWWTDGEQWVELNKVKIRELVFNGCGPLLWAGWVTTSYKKHGSTRAPVNKKPHGVWAFDEMLVDCRDISKVISWHNMLRMAQDAGINRTVIETLEIPVFVYNKIDGKLWIEFKLWAMDKRESALYKFLCYLLPSQAELKEMANSKEEVITPNVGIDIKHDSFTVNKQLSLF